MITEQSFKEFIKGAPSAVVVTLYALARYHEKYRLTAWALNELKNRGFNENDISEWDTNFTNFYDDMLKQENL